MIRILHVLPRLRRGGSQAVVMNLFRQLDRTRFQFDFIIFTQDHDDYYDEIIQLGGKIFHFTKFNGKNFSKIKKEWKNFFKSHPEYKILHSHVRSFASIYLPIARKFNVKTIIHSHSSSNEKGFKGLIKSLMEYPLRFQADYLLACSTEAGKWLFGKKSVNKDNYLFFPNAIDFGKFVFDATEREAIRKKVLPSPDCFLVGHVGGLETPKNHSFLLDVFSELTKLINNAYLLLVGDGTLEKEIKKKAVDLQLEDKVIFAGLQTNISPFLSAMDVLVFPSLWEGLPVTLVEAQSSGLQCLVSNNITKDVRITDLITYMPLSEGSLSWAKQVVRLSDNQVDRLNFRKENNFYAFDIKKAVSSLESFYEKILD